ncbi:mitogen-activated protein kinase kinase kinase 19 [Pseudophryne corroboree]|uniref:mitogen-activated protein kinase kinase kinase 19 n=1 Tax=Pseudophryne corroboree TaxID=495146 RepID=UPI0030814F56
MVMEKTTQDGNSLLLFLEAVVRGNLEELIGHLSTDPRLINTQHPESGDTALTVAAGENNLEVITLLLEHGADVTLYNSSNLTAVHVANDVIRTQLLTAVTRTEFPQLGLAQAAWQGDLETIQHQLSTECCHYVNSRNEQGLTPVMLVVRDLDLFVGLAMETEYRPLAVLEELLKHHADTRLLDPNGNSVINYISESKNPLREQLTAVLEKSPPLSETQDEAFCDFCPDTKPPLSDTPLPRLNSPDIHSRVPGQELSCDGLHTGFVSEDLNPGAELGTVADIEETSTSMHTIETADQMKKNSIPQHGCTDPSLEHLTLRSDSKRHRSPLHLKKEDDVSQLERLGLGYLIQHSQSNPNISESHFRTDPLRGIKYIKENIRQRLGSADSSKDSQTYPPSSHSPRCSQSVRLVPLSKNALRNKEVNISYIDLNSNSFTALKADGQLCGHNTLRTSMDNSEDVMLSKDLVQISCPSFSSESTHGLINDPSRISQQSIITGSGRSKTVEVSEDVDSAGLRRNVEPELPVNDKTQIRSSTESGSTMQVKQEICEVIMRNIPSENEKYVPDPSDETEKVKQKDSSSSNRKAEENVQTPEPVNEDARKRNYPIKRDISKIPRQGPMPFVQINFSKHGEDKKGREQVIAIRKTNLVSLPHNSHSFNIHAQKENQKTKKKKKTRSMSAPDCATKQQRPLFISKRTHSKVVPLPALIFSSVPTSSKVSNMFTHTDPSSINRNRQRLQTQSCLCTTKRPNSSMNTPKPSRAKTSLDFQDLEYSDMFAEIKSQDSGPVISQMFATPVYANTPKSSREANSASSIRSCSSKGSRASSSRDSSARGSKRQNSKYKKNPSATSHRRKNSSTKQLVTEDVEKSTEKPVIISDMDREIKTIKQDEVFSGNDIASQLNRITDPNQQNFSCLSIIKEATIENSLTPNGTGNITLIEGFRELEKIFKDVESGKPKLLSRTLPTETIKTESVQQGVCPINSNEQNEDGPGVQDPNIGSLMQSLEKRCAAAEQSSGAVPQSQQAAAPEHLTYNEHFWREILIENSVYENNLDQQSVNSQSHKSIDNCTGSERLMDELISHMEKNLFVEESSSDTNILESRSGKADQSLNCQDQQDNTVSSYTFSRDQSLEDIRTNTNNPNQTENHSDLSHNDNSILWIKGEVLGRGAYGTVYRGLTSQGELIAAKQVMLHGSDPAVAEKEYRKLQEEVDLLKTLKHVNIVGYLGTCLQDTVVTIFMEFVPGGSISSILKHFGPLQECIISKYTSHILQGIAYLHKNRVVHRDIKGNNVMLMPNGVIKLIDFGCAKRLNGLSMNGTQWEMLTSMHGTPYWMAPEVICESGHGEKSDIWSIGCTVFEMATGKPPLAHMHKLAAMFYIGKKQGLMPTLPGHFSKRARSFVDLCLTRDQEDRPFAEQLLQHSFIRQKL